MHHRHMPRQTLFVAAALLAASPLVHAQKLGEVPRFEPSKDAEAGKVLEWTTPEGQEYWYRLPKKARGGRKPALILMLHGTGLNHGWSFWNYPIASGEFRGDDIVVSPDGLTPGNGDTFNFVQAKDDREQIRGLIEHFRGRFEVGNVYLYGHSQGAFFAYWFAGEHPELVDGIVAHAGNVLANVKHPKLAKEKVAIGILHARSDQVVPVVCAESTQKVYEEQGYTKLKCWIVEDIRPEAGHWPLPPHVTTMFEWLDSVCTGDAAQAVEVAVSALLRETPDLATAVRAAADARAQVKKYRGEDAAAVAQRLGLVERALGALGAATGSRVTAAINEHEGGKAPGPYAADVRWARRELGALDAFEAATKPHAALFKKHDKALTKLARLDGDLDARYVKTLTDILEDSWLAPDWDAVHARESKRAEGGAEAAASLAQQLGRLGTECGAAPSEPWIAAVREARDGFVSANPGLSSD